VLPLDDPEFYPLAAGDFRGIAPTIAFSADIDPLRDDARVYVERLQDAGVAARWINEPGLVHDYLRARHVSRIASAAFTRICDAISELATQNPNQQSRQGSLTPIFITPMIFVLLRRGRMTVAGLLVLRIDVALTGRSGLKPAM
jgi:hypothetical protein